MTKYFERADITHHWGDNGINLCKKHIYLYVHIYIFNICKYSNRTLYIYVIYKCMMLYICV